MYTIKALRRNYNPPLTPPLFPLKKTSVKRIYWLLWSLREMAIITMTIICISKKVSESNRVSPDLTYSLQKTLFFHLMAQFLFHPDIHGGSFLSTAWLFKEYLMKLKNMYVSTVLFAKHSSQAITLVALKSCWCTSKVFAHREQVQSSDSSLSKQRWTSFDENNLRNNEE